MVILALTPDGFTEALRLANGVHPVWCSASAVSHEQLAGMHLTMVTRFVYSLDDFIANPSVLEGALDTIGQHHPGERVWVERLAAA
ncbi:hypothetical protein METUNv1_02176 [Methyloversatilis universalis FAM5]|uniref:Uncharacterized protein n=1 Tax=Methyloversatilis universalis (strain ATCC BAA-1314 / DSM 25237 / JCM 13912 / CCUG 52030 / FAM5) TaxID=1000565 RepID=F5RD19_METUF|nr:hypothetical protein [Methyloversatilis universalis]EGK71670.1 hypothetical protein METUNv1_02176 [Methyloversatilis universalis FAM5]